MEADREGLAKALFEIFTQLGKAKKTHSPIAGMKPSEIFALFSIQKLSGKEKAGVMVSQVSSELNIATPTATQLINGLEERGYVERKTDTQDRRIVQVKLTKKSEEAIKKAKESYRKHFEGLVDYLGIEESRQFAGLMAKVIEYLKIDRGTPA